MLVKDIFAGTTAVPVGWLSMAAGTEYSDNAAMNLAPDDVLERCPTCGAWPMAAFDLEQGVTWARLTFKCTRCQRPQTVELTQLRSEPVKEPSL